MRGFLLGCVVLTVLTQTSEAKDYIKIGSWNIENLGQRRFGQNRFAIAEYLQLADLDVLALQEIHDTDGEGAPYRNRKLDQVFELMNERDGQEWKYELFPKRDGDTTFQLCGVAWNSARVTKVGAAHRIPLDHQDNGLWDRHPYAVKFRAAADGKNDIVVISIHMKSNLRKPNTPLPTSRRAREAKALAAAFAKISTHFDDKDIIILGDTNCLKADEAALSTFKQLGLRDLNSKDASTYVSDLRFDDDDIGPAFDHIFVPDDESEFKYSQQLILQPADRDAHDKMLSDHLLIMTSVQIMNDDD